MMLNKKNKNIVLLLSIKTKAFLLLFKAGLTLFSRAQPEILIRGANLLLKYVKELTI